MTPGARLAAAAEVLEQVLVSRVPADRAMHHWGRARRFAGSKDRAAIAERVYAVLRRLSECEYALGARDPRSLVLGSLRIGDGLSLEQIEALALDGTHALGALTDRERSALASPPPASDVVRLNVPAWLVPRLRDVFGDSMGAALDALNQRAPLDLRVNTLKATRSQVLAELDALGLSPALIEGCPDGLRFEAGSNVKIHTLACHIEGRVEVQDASSQRAVLLAAPKPGEIVVDLAAGAGGKALAIAALMENRGRVLACDISAERLKALDPRRARAGATIIDGMGSPYGEAITRNLPSGADLVFVDAPCSGSGTWRRNPESKWNLDEALFSQYMQAQRQLLERAAALTSPQGRIVYAVCSVLPDEAERQISAFCADFPAWKATATLRLAPHSTGGDGFFAAELRRA
jgi:16S rRNA (cytosine967-C5)-methyltransferase